jgi:hypothetical protein
VYKVGETVIKAEEIPLLLKRYQLMPQFLREVIIDGAIAGID